MTLYLVRHGAVDQAYKGCYNGWLDVALSPEGHEEARTLADRLSAVPFDSVYASDLIRSRESLACFKPKNVVYDERLREKSWGNSEGMDYDAICKKLGIVYENFVQWVEALGGESLEAFRSRVMGVFFEEIARAQEKNVLVMTHAGVIRTLLAFLERTSLEEAFARPVPTGSYTRIERTPEGWRVREVGVK